MHLLISINYIFYFPNTGISHIMNIECPSDYDIPASENRFIEDHKIFRVPEIFTMKKRKRKNHNLEFSIISKEKQREEKKDKGNYFQEMYKEAKKKMYVNLFSRKIKQGVVRNSKPNHHLLDEKINSDFTKIKAFKWNFPLEVAYTLFVILCTFATSIIATLAIAFPEVVVLHFSKAISFVTVVKQICEIVFNCTSQSTLNLQGKKHKNVYISDLTAKYVKNWFIVDFLLFAIYLTDLFFHFQGVTVVKLLVILKIWQALEKMQNLQLILIQNCFKEQYWELIKVFLANFLFAHFLAIFLVVMTKGQDENWLTKSQLHQQSWSEQYVWSYYWATTIMLTIGFGDLTPTNTEQVVTIIFIETFSCIFLAYNINNVGTIIRKITSYQEEKIKNLKIFAQMDGREDTSDDINNKITNFLTKSAELKRKYNIEEQQQLLEKLPKSFNEQFKQESTVKIFQHIPFFRNLPLSKLKEISMKIQKKLTHPEEILVQCNTIPEILIINNGKIALTMNRIGLSRHGEKIQEFQIKPNEYKIISLYFFMNRPINYDIVCKNYSIIYSLKKSILESILSTNPYCYELYCMNRDKDLYNSNDIETELCSLCSETKSHHTLFECPRMHYIPIKSVVISQMMRKNPKKMKQILQKDRKRANKIVMNSLKYYISVNDEESFNESEHGNSGSRKRFIMFDERKRKLSQIEFGSLGYIDRLEKKISINTMCQKVGEKIKDEIFKNTTNFHYQEFKWDIESDIAHDFAFYFLKSNPSRIGELFKKRNVRKDGFAKYYRTRQNI